MALALNKIPKKQIDYIKNHYKTETAEEISDKINLKPHQIRDIARQIGITKRFTSEELYPNDTYWTDIYHPKMTFSNYEISDYGHVRRKDDHTAIQWGYTEDGYRNVKLVNDDGIRKTLLVNRLVGETFCIVRATNQTEVDHMYGNKDDNYFMHLRWVTPSENQKYSYQLGLRKPANLKHDLDTEIALVCKLISEGLTNKEILNTVNFEIREENIQNIRAKRTHKKISDKYF